MLLLIWFVVAALLSLSAVFCTYRYEIDWRYLEPLVAASIVAWPLVIAISPFVGAFYITKHLAIAAKSRDDRKKLVESRVRLAESRLRR